MTVFMYLWECRDCKVPVEDVKCGVSEFGELVTQFTCPKCGHLIICRTPLEKIVADIPDSKPPQLTDLDRKLLKGLKVKYD